MRLRPPALLAGVLMLLATAAHSATIEREFRYDASRVQLVQRDGYTLVEAKGGMPEFRVGRPDLPWLAERVDLAPGTKITGIELVDVQTAPLGVVRTMASAEVTHPGLGETERTRPDARFYGSSKAQPEETAALGAQAISADAASRTCASRPRAGIRSPAWSSA